MSLRDKIRRFSDERWNIGFLKNSIESVMRGEPVQVDWVKHHCKASWFADPFILDVTDSDIVLLVEEFYKPKGRGRISRLTIDRQSNELKQLDVVLDLPTHLSFPVIIRQEEPFGRMLAGIESSVFRRQSSDGDEQRLKTNDQRLIYLLPENGESGHLWAYKYWPSANRIERVGSVLDEAVEDAIPVERDGEVYLYCTPRSNPNGNELRIYRFGQEDGKFHYVRSHTFEENVARMAGRFFAYGDHLIRPTQECNTQYGHAVTLQELNDDGFKELRRMYSVNPQLTVGSHTFNIYKGVIVTDALGFDNMWLRRMLKALHLKQ